jgi:LmbE family N-acetylglucosaminyl deacetylase
MTPSGIEALSRSRRPMVIVAHPDDEVIGAGALLGRLPAAAIVHVTDGAPRDLADAQAAGFATAGEYSAARRREASAALALIPSFRGTVVELDIPDQEAARCLVALTGRLRRLFTGYRPDAVLTHAFEGGHPDHDAAAFAVHAAARLQVRSRDVPPSLYELTGYHARNGGLVVGRFVSRSGPAPSVLRLPPEDRDRKRRMLGCFASQSRTLRPFLHHLATERIRPAPRYRFSARPHEGPLWYERFRWGGLTGERWCALAAAGLAELGLAEPL